MKRAAGSAALPGPVGVTGSGPATIPPPGGMRYRPAPMSASIRDRFFHPFTFSSLRDAIALSAYGSSCATRQS